MVTTVYLDLDGVFADFEGRVHELCGKHPPDLTSLELWDLITYYNSQEPFFFNLEVKKETMPLLDYLLTQDVSTEILTARGTKDTSGDFMDQKIRWVRKHMGDLKVNFVDRGAEKGLYFANPSVLLIDDMERNVLAFRDHGGHALHFTNNTCEIIDLLKGVIS